ncbi:MAG: hypothetical protein R2830_14815 [Saprospiraceae bacterium]
MIFLLLGWLAVSCQSPEPPHAGKDVFHLTPHPDPITVPAKLPLVPDTILQTAHFQFLSHGVEDTGAIRPYAEKCEAAFEKIQAFADYGKPLDKVRYHLYNSIEEKGLILQSTAPSQFDLEKWEVHAVLDDIYSQNPCGKENQLLLRKILGQPATPILECGLAIHFMENWQERGYRYWAAKLFKCDALLPLADLFDKNFWNKSSDIILGCQVALFTDFLIQQWGKPGFLKKYPLWQPTPAETATLQPLWEAYLSAQFPTLPDETKSGEGPASLPYLKGFNFAHEGYRMHNGYGSKKADMALANMKNSLGANAVAIIPYSFLQNPNVPVPVPVVKHSGAETDEAVIHTCVSSKKLGLKVMLKPQIWMGGGRWPGDIEMQDEKDWEAFFKYYNHWIIHYAILAELYDVDLLCLGTEMVKTTTERESDWRKLIQSARKIYHGNLTYAANWGEEFEHIKLWDELDYIGLNCYYPLSQKDNPSDRELVQSFEGILKKVKKVSEQFRKPVIFTEIGFASVEAPWKKPHEDWGDLSFNADHQKRCYEVVFKCIEGKPWCRGILWWKFPSDMDSRRRRDTDFSPYNKPAEGVVKKWFGKI